jgi:hypothetical protein
VYRPSALIQVHKLLILPSHYNCRDVMGVEIVAELSSWHLVIHGASGDIVGPPCAGVSLQLLHGKENLLMLRAT